MTEACTTYSSEQMERAREIRGEADIAAAAALLAEPARAEIVLAVIDEGPLAASVLAERAGIALSTASEHLERLVDGGFLVTSKNGRRRFYRLADPAVAEAVEALARVAPQPPVRSLREANRSEQLRYVRTCYDHLAGQIGVAVARRLVQERTLVSSDGTYVLGPNAEQRFGDLGIDVAKLRALRRPLVRGCLDWSERELHLAGALGAALATRLFELGWIRRRTGTRAVEITEIGLERLRSDLSVELS